MTHSAGVSDRASAATSYQPACSAWISAAYGWSRRGSVDDMVAPSKQIRVDGAATPTAAGDAGSEIGGAADVTFSHGMSPMPSMDSAIATIEPRDSVEAVYRADAERLWRAVYAFAGDAEIASDAVAEAFAQVLQRDHTPARLVIAI